MNKIEQLEELYSQTPDKTEFLLEFGESFSDRKESVKIMYGFLDYKKGFFEKLSERVGNDTESLRQHWFYGKRRIPVNQVSVVLDVMKRIISEQDNDIIKKSFWKMNDKILKKAIDMIQNKVSA